MSEQASADKLEYTTTLGIIAMEGRGFEYPTDMMAIRCENAKTPAEFTPGIPRMSGELDAPRHGMIPRRRRIAWMEQAHNNQPAIEGWRPRLEWLSAAALMKRANFASDQLGDAHKPGVRSMAASTAGPDSVPRIPARTASASDARQPRNHSTTAIIPTTLTTREQAP